MLVRVKDKWATIYFDGGLPRAMRIKAAETDRSLSDLVNEAVRESLAEDAEDLRALEAREVEPEYPFEGVGKKLRADGKL